MNRLSLPTSTVRRGACSDPVSAHGLAEVIALLIVSAPLIAFVAYGLFVQPTH